MLVLFYPSISVMFEPQITSNQFTTISRIPLTPSGVVPDHEFLLCGCENHSLSLASVMFDIVDIIDSLNLASMRLSINTNLNE